MYAIAELGYEAPDTARQYAVNVLSELEKVFRLPSPIAFVAWEGSDRRDSTTVPTMSNEASLTVGPDGQLISIALTQSSLVAPVDSALLSALRVAAQGGGVLPPTVHGITRPLTIFVALSVGPTEKRGASTEPAPADRPVMPARRMVELPLQLLELPVKRYSALLDIDTRRRLPTIYPEDLSRAGWDGEVELEYVVGKDGTVIPRTIRVLGGTERRFATAAIGALKDTHFIPAEIDGCPVSVRVQQRFEFRSGRSGPEEGPSTALP